MQILQTKEQKQLFGKSIKFVTVSCVCVFVVVGGGMLRLQT